eukprot:gnl/Dysnectes_brevis/3011_a3720_1172.p1 GENE.gnl/Dysnectes_brevis/3011_a3720_1172~~gnl/Dysnectes_brevis/3011_a3720_1172.p1  ORF type:complete len:428 (+),score=92.51 gnl/Dysnectes_brevis/3011_a3720_1172:34-1317(+)
MFLGRDQFDYLHDCLHRMRYQLPPVISEFPYIPGLSIGSGINVVTGKLTPSALVPFKEVRVSEGVSERNRRVFISDSRSYGNETSFQASGSCPIPNTCLTGSVGGEYKTAVDFNATTVSLVYSYESTLSEFTRPETTPQFADGIVKRFNLDGSNGGKALGDFRSSYGDYFVVGMKRGSLVNIVFTFKSDSEEHMDEYKVKLGVELTGSGGDVGGEAGFGQSFSRASKNINMDVLVFSHGFRSGAPTIRKIEDVETALEWYRDPANRFDTPLAVQLQHYHTLESGESLPLLVETDSKFIKGWKRYSQRIMALREVYGEVTGRCTIPRTLKYNSSQIPAEYQRLILEHSTATQSNFDLHAIKDIDAMIKILSIQVGRINLLERLKDEEFQRLAGKASDWLWCSDGVYTWDHHHHHHCKQPPPSTPGISG